MATLTSGLIFTFYSYKGGTGRSMALANIACLLAQKWADGQKVLMIDWDLEAPGLHRFFQERVKAQSDSSLEEKKGLIDLFYAMQESCQKNGCKTDVNDEFFDKLDIEQYLLETKIQSLYLMTAGRFDNFYSTKVNKFNWETFFDQNPWLISRFAEYLSRKFRYVLIDSRTGSTDISSVCTALMPERLVLVFTPNRQSSTGVLDLAKKVTDYRRRSDDLRPLVVFPLVSRVENAEEDLQKDWRFGNKQKNIVGYQPEFERIFKAIYDLPHCDLTEYFNEIKLQHVPRYSYGEEIAVLSSRAKDRLSLATSYEEFAKCLVTNNAAWDAPAQSDSKQKTDKGGISIPGKSIRPPAHSPTKLRVFLVHSSSDKPIVRELYQK
jgi:MinD-like ATPase involved in chromosome partitioning or flagellar assembly